MRWAGWIAHNAFDLALPVRARIEENLRAAFGHTLSAAGAERLARDVFEHVARFWVEALYAPRMLTPLSWTRFIRVIDSDVWRPLAASRRPALLVTTYFGNAPIGAFALAQLMRPLHVLVDRANLPILRSWQEELYRVPNLRLVPCEDSLDALPCILEAGGKVMLLAGHERPRGRAVDVPFLGRSRRCYPTIGVLASRFDAPVVVFSNRRVGPAPFRFELRHHATIDPRDFPFHDTIRPITERFMHALDEMVRASPAQYLWTR